MAVSPATVVMLAPPGKTRLAPLVRVKAPVNLTMRSRPSASVIAVIVVVPVTSTILPVAVSRFVVVAEATSAPCMLRASNAGPAVICPVPPLATVTVSLKVEPAAVTVMLLVPSKLVPLMVRAVWSAVAVPALPVIVV